MVHIYCSVKNIKDINYNTGYHNMNFKKICDKIKLKCVKNNNGFTVTSYTEELKSTIQKIIDNTNLVYLFSLYNYNI